MLIYLDIDGVMVPANSWKRPEFLADGFAMFSDKAIRALKKIITKTDAAIVLTTSHKANYSIDEWLNIFKHRGILLDGIEVLPENIRHLNRKDELLSWLLFNKQDNFIIIDDDKSLNDLPQFLKEKWIAPTAAIGLTDELADEAIAILKNRRELLSA